MDLDVLLQVMYDNSRSGRFGGKGQKQEAGGSGDKRHTFYLELLSGRERSTAHRCRPCLLSLHMSTTMRKLPACLLSPAYQICNRTLLLPCRCAGCKMGRTQSSLADRRKGDLWAISNNARLAAAASPGSTDYAVVAQSCWHGPNAEGRCVQHS